jgi:hypothetical protein
MPNYDEILQELDEKPALNSTPAVPKAGQAPTGGVDYNSILQELDVEGQQEVSKPHSVNVTPVKLKGTQRRKPDLTWGRVGGVIVDEMKAGVRNRLIGLAKSTEQHAEAGTFAPEGFAPSLWLYGGAEEFSKKRKIDTTSAWANMGIKMTPEDTQVGMQIVSAAATAPVMGPIGPMADMYYMLTGASYANYKAQTHGDDECTRSDAV